ncbi:LAME_0F04192g1_1 [Lachancea meyersii CBS 8951]|uniref:[acyl-carrier-protein] S-malonyltransferase n=1 Tax=Lachancea meyersii CBS 8951 TaxID=1266667 RepID=A0A1G4JRS9_9SACH|nr:LAME_0F04192g1_1 [Lachancea meyersii CBS 8951]
MKRLVTFPGQGRPVLGHVFNSYLAQRSRLSSLKLSERARETAAVGAQIEQKPTDPASIAACSYLLYETFLEHAKSEKSESSDLVFLGHSLGELSCLAAGNGLFTLHQTMEIATYRNELMMKAAGNLNYGMWAISVPKARDLAREVRSCVFAMGNTMALANVNTGQQCVITGTDTDFQRLEPRLRETIDGRYRITQLENPYHIPFHNQQVLAPVAEPLLDFMWKILKKQGLASQWELSHEVVSNLTGTCVRTVSQALENFAHSSCNVVEFVKCCETVSKLNVTEIVSIGPGTHIGKLVATNCHIPNARYWDEHMGNNSTADLKAL